MAEKRSDNQKGNLVLGIDIGTTSVKVCLVDKNSRQVISKQSKDTQANVPSDLGSEGNKQYVPKILSALHGCVSRLPKDQLRNVYRIGISGQMHGIMLWSNKEAKAWECTETNNGCKYDVRNSQVSALYTWQDSRCDPQFLATLPVPESHLRIYSGLGCATLFWMARYKPEKFERFNRAGTIQDFVVAMLCDLDIPLMSVQNAASWGYFDTTVRQWNTELLERAGFPVQLLPKVLKSGEIAGKLTQSWNGIPIGTEIGAGLGDFQCSVLATLDKPSDAVLNISTSAQLAFIMPAQFQPDKVTKNVTPIEYFPYFDGKYLAVAASLNGGNSLATFVRTLQQWTLELGFQVPQAKIWDRVLVLAADEEKSASSLSIVPTLLGERHAPEQNAQISDVDLGNLGLGQVFRALCHGVIQNLHSMMPHEMLVDHKVDRVIGIGSALVRNKVLQQAVRQSYQLPLDFTSGGDAALGAAIAIIDKHGY